MSDWRVDNWQNVILGLNQEGIDKVQETTASTLHRTSVAELRNLYHNDYLTYKIVTTLPADALSLGYTIKGLDDPDPLYAAAKRLKVVQRLRAALVWERLFGGSVLFAGVNDGQNGDDSQTLPMGEPREVYWFRDIDRRYIYPEQASIVQDVTSPDFDQAQLYALLGRAPSRSGGHTYKLRGKIHRSRLIIFPGEDTTDDVREANFGWGLSVIDRVMQALKRHATAWLSAGYIVSESSYNQLKIPNLMDLMAAGKEDVIKARARVIAFNKGVSRTVLLGDGEDLTTKERSFTGLPEMMQLFMIDLAAAADMPVTKLFGRSAEGMNATGEGDADNWTTKVDGYREEKVAPALVQMLTLIAQSLGLPTQDLEVEFPELQPMSDNERADVFTKKANGAKALVDGQIFQPEEMALALADDMGIEINRDERQQVLDADKLASRMGEKQE